MRSYRRRDSGRRACGRSKRRAFARRNSAVAGYRDRGRNIYKTYPAQHYNTHQEVAGILHGYRRSAFGRYARFELGGIPPAPRGVPQIEVTFDIDANGIVHVSARDKGTGKEQRVTITASTNLTEQQIQQAIKDAEKFAEEDNKRKEVVEAKNHADMLIFNIEKFLKDNGSSVSPSDKEELEKEMANVREVIKTDELEAITDAVDSLQKLSNGIFTKLYESGAAGDATANPGDDVVVEDAEVVDDNQ